jgi:AcrR family transcriptional regulator
MGAEAPTPRVAPPGAGPRRERALDAIVAAAARLFEERGIDATSIDEIAHSAGVSRQTVFNHVPYKEALLVEIGARYVEEIAATAGQHRRRSPRRALDDLADAVASVAIAHPAIVPGIAREMTHPDPSRREYAARRMQYPALYQALLGEMISAGLVRRGLRRSSLERQLVDLTTGTLIRVGAEVVDIRAELRANVDLFWEGAISRS